MQVALNNECLLAHSGPVMLSLWRGTLTHDAISTHFLVAGELRRKYTRFGLLVVVEPNAPPPKLDGRKLLGDLYKQLAPNLLCAAFVLRGEGFLLSGARAIMSAVLAPYSFPARTFANTDSAVPWISNYMSARHAATTRDELQRIVATAYAEYTWQVPVDSPRRLAV